MQGNAFCNYCGKQMPKDDLEDAENGGCICPKCRGTGAYKQCIDCGLWCKLYARDRCHQCYCNLSQCAWCGDNYPDSDLHSNRDGRQVCTRCRDRYNLIICAGCGGWSELYDDNADGDGMCEECCEHSGALHQYHHAKNVPLLFYPDREQDLYLGVELETDGYDKPNDSAEALLPLSKDESLFTMEEDGSLDCGIEIVSMPATLEYHEKQFPWKQIMKKAVELGGKSHNVSTCGLHVHFNRNYFGDMSAEQDVHIAKLLYFFEKFWGQLVTFSRRTERDLENNARKYRFDATRESPKVSVEIAKANGSHYHAINLCNEATIEIRIFKGTLKLDTFYASLELMDFLLRWLMKHRITHLHKITWSRFVLAIPKRKHHVLIEYLKERRLYVPDNS